MHRAVIQQVCLVGLEGQKRSLWNGARSGCLFWKGVMGGSVGEEVERKVVLCKQWIVAAACSTGE